MEKSRIQSILFVVLLMIPLAYATVDVLSDVDDSYELTENFGEEEGNDERESEEDKEIDDVEFAFTQQASVVFEQVIESEFQLRNNKINKRSKDVLLPPPEFV